MRQSSGLARTESTEPASDEWTVQSERGDETVAGVKLVAGPEVPLDEVATWQRLGDVIGRITGMIEVDGASPAQR